MTAKRGQGLPLNTIIIAILVVTVLVVLVVVFTGGIGKFTPSLEDCEAQGGTCLEVESCPSGYSKAPLAKCPSGVCCIKVMEATCEELGGTCYTSSSHERNAANTRFICWDATGYKKIDGNCPDYVGLPVDCCIQD